MDRIIKKYICVNSKKIYLILYWMFKKENESEETGGDSLKEWIS